MGMRIWHQSFTVLQDLPAYAGAMESHLARIMPPGIEVVLHGQKLGTYPGNYPGDDLSYRYLYMMHGHQWVEGALAAEREGFDAYAMCTLMNPLINEIRTLVDIPVVGYGESCFHLASMYGQRFGVLLFIDRLVPLYSGIVADYGLAQNCAGIEGSGLVFADVLAGFADPAPVIERFCEAARRMIRERGADVIIPGEVPMSMLLAVNGINRVDDVPVMDGLATTIKMAAFAVDMKRATGISHSRHGWLNAMPPRERVREVNAFYGVDRLSKIPDGS